MPVLLETIDAVFLPKLNSHLAARLGESTTAVRRGLEAGMAVVLNGLMVRPVAADSQCAVELDFPFVELPGEPQAILTRLLVIVGSKEMPGSPMGQGEVLLTLLFGSAKYDLVNSLSDYAGMKPESARTLLELLAALLPTVISQFAERQKLTAEATSVAVRSVAERTRARIPRELTGASEALGLRNAKTMSWENIQTVVQDVTALRSGLLARWHVLIMAGLAVGILGLGMAVLGSDSVRVTGQEPALDAMTQNVETMTTVGQKQVSVL